MVSTSRLLRTSVPELYLFFVLVFFVFCTYLFDIVSQEVNCDPYVIVVVISVVTIMIGLGPLFWDVFDVWSVFSPDGRDFGG